MESRTTSVLWWCKSGFQSPCPTNGVALMVSARVALLRYKYHETEFSPHGKSRTVCARAAAENMHSDPRRNLFETRRKHSITRTEATTAAETSVNALGLEASEKPMKTPPTAARQNRALPSCSTPRRKKSRPVKNSPEVTASHLPGNGARDPDSAIISPVISSAHLSPPATLTSLMAAQMPKATP